MKQISDIKVGYSCNNECIHCVIKGNRDYLIKLNQSTDRSFDECREEILKAVEGGATEMVITGGEPTIREDFLEILALLNSHAIICNIQTNGRRFSDHEFCRKVSAFPCIYFSIAVHGPNSAIHDHITQRKRSFDQTKQGIKNLVKNEKPVSVKYVISKSNYKFIKETIDLMEELEVKHINLTFPHGIGSAGTFFYDVVPKYEELEPYLYEAFQYCCKKNVYFETETIPYCFLREFEECASEHFHIGYQIETRAIGVEAINWLKKRPEDKKKAPQCCQCSFYHICEGTWTEYIDHYGASEFKPVEADPKTMFPILLKIKKIKSFRSVSPKNDLGLKNEDCKTENELNNTRRPK